MNLSTRISTVPAVRRAVLTLLAASVVGALGIATAGAATPDSAAAAVAVPTADALSVTVRYGDLDLASAAGTRALYRRLVVAAKQVCPDSGSREMTILRFEETCRNQAIVNAARQIPSPQLAAMVASSIKAS